MVRLNVRPAPHLRHLIRGYQYMNVPAHPEGFVVPAQERAMLILPAHTEYRVEGDIAERIELHRATILGPHRAPIVNRTERPICGFTVDFTPLGMSMLIGVPQEEIVDRGVNAADLFDLETVRELYESAGRCDDPHSSMEKLNTLFGRLQRQSEGRPATGIAAVSEALDLAAVALSAGRPSEATVERLSGRVGISTRHLNREFHRLLGMGPKQYLLIARIGRSMGAIAAAPERDLSTLAIEQGFFDYSHFCHAFKRATLATPSEFRSSLRYKEYGVVASIPSDRIQKSPGA
mgnify:CR=1 FL=1